MPNETSLAPGNVLLRNDRRNRKPSMSMFEQALQADIYELRKTPLEDVEVALLDTGVDATHQDLASSVVESVEIVSARGRYHERSHPAPTRNDSSGHGTAVASVIARLAPNARITDLRIAENEGGGRGEAVLAGLRGAWERRVRVINVSLACERRFLAPLIELCEAAYFRNQVVVAAELNDPALEKGLPAELSNCIGVTCDRSAHSRVLRFRKNHRIEFSAFGREVAVAVPGNSYGVRSGTSLAAGTVTGLCTLLLGAFPDLTPFEVKTVLRTMASRAAAEQHSNQSPLG
jgi:subtilisin